MLHFFILIWIIFLVQIYVYLCNIIIKHLEFDVKGRYDFESVIAQMKNTFHNILYFLIFVFHTIRMSPLYVHSERVHLYRDNMLCHYSSPEKISL